MTTTDESISGTEPCRRKAWLGVVLFTLACAATVAYQLRLFEFSNGGENAVLESVLELRRGDDSWRSWLTPTLHDELRTKKPPLATWLSAISARPATVAKLSDPDPAVRALAFETFAWQVRLPALLAMCGVLIATFVLGSLVADRRLGLIAAIVCGTSLFWLRNARLATTDGQLALWVGVTNCFLAAAVLRRTWWRGFIGGGIALGLAMMSKGPVALVQTVLPVLTFVIWRWWNERGSTNRHESPPPEPAPPQAGLLAPLLLGLVLFAIVGLSWYGYVFLNNPGVMQQWRSEVTREGATDMEPSRWYNYVLLVMHVFPWCFFFVAGLIGAGIVAARKQAAAADDDDPGSRHIVLALSLLLVPVVVMSFFRDREIRYLIPLLPPASILAGWAVTELLAWPEGPPGRSWLVGFHWIPLLLVTTGLLVAASPGGVIQTREHMPWYSMPQAIAGEIVLAAIVLIAAWAQQKRRWMLWALPVGTALVMLPWYVVLNEGYRFYPDGRSEMRPLAEQILASHPDAKVYSFRADRPVRRAPIDLAIYLNRTIQNVSDPKELAGTTGPRVYVVREKVKDASTVDPMTFAPPAGGPWRYFASAKTNSAVWLAYIAGAE